MWMILGWRNDEGRWAHFLQMKLKPGDNYPAIMYFPGIFFPVPYFMKIFNFRRAITNALEDMI